MLPRVVDDPAELWLAAAPAATAAEAPDVLVALASFANPRQPYATLASAKTVSELLIVRYIIANGNLMLSMWSHGCKSDRNTGADTT